METNNWILEYLEYSKKLGRQMQQEMHYAEADDVSQDLMVYLLENAKQLRTQDEKLIRHAMKVRASMYAEDQRKQHLILSVQYAYRTSHVRSLLETLNCRDKWQDAYVPDEAKSRKGHDGIEMSSDVSWAFSRMTNENWKNAIISRYRDGIVPETGTAASKILSKAIISLTDILNSYHRPEPRRKSVTNAQAQRLISSEAGFVD